MHWRHGLEAASLRQCGVTASKRRHCDNAASLRLCRVVASKLMLEASFLDAQFMQSAATCFTALMYRQQTHSKVLSKSVPWNDHSHFKALVTISNRHRHVQCGRCWIRVCEIDESSLNTQAINFLNTSTADSRGVDRTAPQIHLSFIEIEILFVDVLYIVCLVYVFYLADVT